MLTDEDNNYVFYVFVITLFINQQEEINLRRSSAHNIIHMFYVGYSTKIKVVMFIYAIYKSRFFSLLIYVYLCVVLKTVHPKIES